MQKRIYHTTRARPLAFPDGIDLIEYQLDDEDCHGHSVWLARRDK
jgi:hypothetical protein